MRLIDADNLFENNVIIVRGEDGEVVAQQMIEIIRNAPTIEAEPVVQWISVDDKLPPLGNDVLMYFDSGNMAVGFMTDQDEYLTFWSAYTDDGWFTDCDCPPIYWKQLPKPPICDNKADLEE